MSKIQMEFLAVNHLKLACQYLVLVVRIEGLATMMLLLPSYSTRAALDRSISEKWCCCHFGGARFAQNIVSQDSQCRDLQSRNFMSSLFKVQVRTRHTNG
jgi:hypothetical protein